VAEDAENQVAIRGKDRYVPRLEPMPKEAVSVPSEEDSPRQLDITERGVFENLFWRKAGKSSPDTGQVKIDVRAAGLNFRDVLNALGTYAGGPVPFGGECAGTVVEIGETVAGLKPGDRVLAIAPHSFSSSVTADRHLVWRIPEGMHFEQAAALPIAYTTAAYALQHLAGLRAGQRVLIHAAAGGVGLAAVHLARRVGARLFVTAGSPEKRSYLKRLGIPHVMDSRTLEFAETIMAVTRGEGVDVVVNSLAGDFIASSLGVTAQGGTFLELGRSGTWTPEEVERSRPDVAYHAIDLTEDMARRPENVRPLFDAILEQIAAGALPPLPCRVFLKDATVDAFRYMARAKHIGKIVVSWPGKTSLSLDMPLARPDRTYWVTGGLGALGLFTAEWLAAKGAGHIVLTGRNHPTPAAEKKLAEIRHKGTGVTVMAADVSRRSDVDRVIDAIRKDCPPLGGIFHAAGVLDDGVLRHQNWERFETVLRPKIAGAWNLHQSTRHLSLDFMVLYSSVAGLLGSPGQANHCAANAFMDGLAHLRQGAGLPCLSINWGAWAEAGAAVVEEASSRAALKGVGRFSPETGLQLLEYLIRTNKTQAVALLVDWRKYIHHTYPDGLPAPLLDNLTTPGLPKSTAPALRRTPTPALLLQLQSAPATQKIKMLTAWVHHEALRILGLDPSETVDLEKPLHDLGLDSLMAVELRNALGRSVERTLSATLLFDYPSINSVTNYLARELNIGPAQPPSPAAPVAGVTESTEDLLRRIEAMQDGDIDRLFSQKEQERN
jgi:NADPH:quinone reductase-like Zn-dependent oxidoreductase/acyl carrier protein